MNADRLNTKELINFYQGDSDEALLHLYDKLNKCRIPNERRELILQYNNLVANLNTRSKGPVYKKMEVMK